MLTKSQLRIFDAFTQNIFREYSQKEMKIYSKEKSNNAITSAVKQFKKENLITERKIGRSSLYSPNTANDLIYQYIALINQSRMPKPAQKPISILKEGIEKITQFYCLVIFGSYAVQKQSNSSDLDIAIFIESDDQRKQIQPAINAAKLKSAIVLDAHIISKAEFLAMLKADDENLGKQIARKHMTVRNHQIFYDILMEGIKNGFRI